jgi:hypothetical protein
MACFHSAQKSNLHKLHEINRISNNRVDMQIASRFTEHVNQKVVLQLGKPQTPPN